MFTHGQRRKHFPLSETPTSRSTRSIATDTFKPSHRRRECFLKYPFLPSLSSPTSRQFNPGGTHIRLALVSTPHSQLTDYTFRIFDRSVCSRLRREDLDASLKTFTSINETAINPSSSCRATSGLCWFLLAQATMKAQRMLMPSLFRENIGRRRSSCQ